MFERIDLDLIFGFTASLLIDHEKNYEYILVGGVICPLYDRAGKYLRFTGNKRKNRFRTEKIDDTFFKPPIYLLTDTETGVEYFLTRASDIYIRPRLQ